MAQRGTINVTALDGNEIVGIAINRIKGHTDNTGYTVYIASQGDIYWMNTSSYSTSTWTLFYRKFG